MGENRRELKDETSQQPDLRSVWANTYTRKESKNEVFTSNLVW